jgi:hypothetical protein
MKLGSDKLLKIHFMGVKNDQILEKSRHEKSRRFGVFLDRFFSFWTEKWSIGIYRKTAPTKSTVLGPGPPPWEKHKFYRFLLIFDDFGAFNRAGKTDSKIGIYALPPSKSEFYGQFMVFNSSRPNLSTKHDSYFCLVLSFTLSLLVLNK